MSGKNDELLNSIVGQWVCLNVMQPAGIHPMADARFVTAHARPIDAEGLAHLQALLESDASDLYLMFRESLGSIQTAIDSVVGCESFDQEWLRDLIQPVAHTIQVGKPIWWSQSSPSFAYPYMASAQPPSLSRCASTYPEPRAVRDPTGGDAQRFPYVRTMPMNQNFPDIDLGNLFLTAPRDWRAYLEPSHDETEPSVARCLADVAVDDFWSVPSVRELDRTPVDMPTEGIAEINGPADWARLVERFPHRRPGAILPWNHRPATWVDLDIAGVSQKYRGIHLSFWGYLTTSCTPWITSHGPTALVGWPPASIMLFPK